MRLIDADALIKSTDKEIVHMWEIALAPTVDAEPVVRCRDCKHYWKNCPTNKTLTSTLNAVCLASPKEDAFCSYGERREDADT